MVEAQVTASAGGSPAMCRTGVRPLTKGDTMKVCIASVMTVVMVLISVPVPVFTQETFDFEEFEEIEETFDCEGSTLMGRNNASRTHIPVGWFMVGVGSGFLLPLISIPVVGLAASASKPKPKSIPQQEKINESCYINGYTRKARAKNAGYAVLGGVVGTVVSTILLYNAMSSMFSSLESND
jgi:hypothetical protein